MQRTPFAMRARKLQANLLERASQSPPADWLHVLIGGADCGVCSPSVAGFLTGAISRCRQSSGQLVFDDADLDFRGRSELLNDAARRLLEEGLVRGWRDEALDVRAAPGAEPIAIIERAACRALGLTTCAVHLNAFAATDDDGGKCRMWIARRATNKQIDSGLLDNLVGGMVPAGEDEHAALVREAFEEAGLDLSRASPRRGGRVLVRRRVPEGYQSEALQVFELTLPVETRPFNRDGEVATISLWEIDEVLAAIERDEFTLESALVALDSIADRADA